MLRQRAFAVLPRQGPLHGYDRHVPGTSQQATRPGSQSSLVRHTYGYFTAHQNPDGALVHSGPKNGEGYQYTDPDGTSYQRNWTYNNDGSPTGIIGFGVSGLVVNGNQVSTLTIINPRRPHLRPATDRVPRHRRSERAGAAGPGLEL